MKVTITIPAYNVSNFIQNVVERTLKQDIDEIIIVDDGSKDETYSLMEKLNRKYNKVHIIKNEKNRGYGGAQKVLTNEALKRGADIVVLLHSDGQHLPEELPVLLEPIKKGKCDMIIGSRALGNMLKGGMPLYKFLGNKTLTFFENLAFGTKLTGFHDGCKACTRELLEKIDFNNLTEDHGYDSEFLLEVIDNKFRISEVAITTVYNGSFSSVNVIKYSLDILKMIVLYQLRRIKRLFK